MTGKQQVRLEYDTPLVYSGIPLTPLGLEREQLPQLPKKMPIAASVVAQSRQGYLSFHIMPCRGI